MLTKRLGTVLKHIPDEGNYCDIGTDHGYLPAAVAIRGHRGKIFAADIAAGPLSEAERQISSRGLKGSIRTVLSDGLKEFLPGSLDCISICGVGAGTVVGILEESPETVRALKKMVLQVNEGEDKIRRWSRKNGFALTDEEMVFEKGRYYPVLVLEKSESVRPVCDENENFLSRILILRENEVYYRYLEEKKKYELALADRIAKEIFPDADIRAGVIRKKWKEAEEYVTEMLRSGKCS